MDALMESAINGTLHHGYALAGEREAAKEAVFDLLARGLGMRREGNPDIHTHECDNLYIDDSRELRELAALRGFGGNRRFFIISFREAQAPAQNALLKLLEEPPQGVHFFLIVPSHEVLIPTVRSRLCLVRLSEKSAEEDLAAARKFLAATPAKRLRLVAPIIKKAQDDKTKPEALEAARAFARAVLLALREEPAPRREALTVAARAADYFADRSASIKMLLEYLSVTLP